MSVVTYEFRVRDYVVLCIEPFSTKGFTTVVIDGRSYSVEPAYDLKNCVAIRPSSDQTFLNKEVVFK